nr:unnamed protein product [Digitaria exilis]
MGGGRATRLHGGCAAALFLLGISLPLLLLLLHHGGSLSLSLFFSPGGLSSLWQARAEPYTGKQECRTSIRGRRRFGVDSSAQDLDSSGSAASLPWLMRPRALRPAEEEKGLRRGAAKEDAGAAADLGRPRCGGISVSPSLPLGAAAAGSSASSSSSLCGAVACEWQPATVPDGVEEAPDA